MITNNERQQIKSLIQNPNFKAFEAFADQYCDKIQYDTVVRDTEWETLKAALLQEGQVQGIKKLIQEMFEEAGKTNE